MQGEVMSVQCSISIFNKLLKTEKRKKNEKYIIINLKLSYCGVTETPTICTAPIKKPGLDARRDFQANALSTLPGCQ